MSVKLTRRQELALIDLGLSRLLDEVLNIPKPTKKAKTTPKPEKKKSRKWTKAQREKFQATMRKVWKKKQATKK